MRKCQRNARQPRGDRGATEFCQANPNGDVPAAAAGHDSIYEWHCRGNQAEPGEAVWHVDPRGFVVELWKPVN